MTRPILAYTRPDFSAPFSHAVSYRARERMARDLQTPVVPMPDRRPWAGFAILVCAGAILFATLGAGLLVFWSLF